MRWLLLFLIVNVLVGMQSALPSFADESNWCIAVWYPSAETPGGIDSIRANSDLIGVVHPFWYTPLPDGTIQAQPGAEDPELLAEWRAAGMTIIPSIFSAEWELLPDPDLRAFHIAQIIDLVELQQYDGIDIDYESFPRFTRDDFSAFIETLSTELHTRDKLLTIAVHPKTSDEGAWEGAAAQDWTRIAPAVDVFTIMTYDYTSRNEAPGPIAPPEWVRGVLTYAARITDLTKVRMGLPFYGYSWLRERPPATTTSWAAAQPLIASFEPEIVRDPVNMEAHIAWKARGLPHQTIYFADSAGIEYKLDLILDEFPELGGVAIWGLGGEDPAAWDVLRAAQQPNCNL